MDFARLQVRIEAVTSGFTQGMTNAQRSAESFGARMQTIGNNMKSVGSTMTKGITLPVAAIGAASAKAAVDFESSFAGVRKTVDATEAEFARLSQGFRNMAKEIPVSVNELNNIGEAAGQLGIKKSNIMEFTRTMADLGVATNMASTEAADSLARLANITQMPQTEFDRLGSTVVDLGNNLATTESEIVEMGLRIAGAGEQVGMTEAQILSFAAALSSVGINAEAGGSAISRVFLNMNSAVQEGGAELAGFAEVAGMSADEFASAFERDAAGAVITFIEGLDRIRQSGGNVTGTLEELGLSEIRVRDALMRAAGAGDLFRESMEIGSQAWRENSALTEEAAKRYETTASQLTILKNRIYDVGINLGGPLVEGLNSFIDSADPAINLIERMAQGFADLSPRTQGIIVGLALIAAAAGPVIWILGSLVTAAGALAGAFAGLSISWAGLGAFLLGPWGIAIAGAVAGIALLAANFDKVRPAAQALWDWLAPARENLQAFFDWVPSAASAVWNWTEPARENLQSFFNWLGEGAQGSEGLSSIWSKLSDDKGAIDNVKEKLGGLFTWIGEKASQSEGLNRIWTKLNDDQGAIDRVREKLGGLFTWISERASQSEGLNRIWTKLKDDQGAVDRVRELLGRVVEFFARMREGVVERVSGMVQRVGEFFGRLRDRPIETVSNLVQRINELFTRMREGVVERVSSMAERVGERVGNLRERLSGYFTNIVEGARTKFDQFRESIVSRVTTARDRAVELANNLKSRVMEIFNSMVGPARSTFERMGDGIVSAVDSAKRRVIDLWNSLLNAIATILEKLGMNDLAGKVRGGTAPGGNNSGADPTPGTVGGRPDNRARGGIDYHPESVATVAGSPRLIEFAEAGKEAFVPLTRETHEGRDAARAVVERYPDVAREHVQSQRMARGGIVEHKGLRPERSTERDHRRAEQQQQRRRPGGSRMEGFGPTMYTLIPELRQVAESVANKFGTPWNTYSNHPPGYPQPYYRERSVDWWGGGGRGDPIGGIWTSVSAEANRQLGSNINWELNPNNDPGGHWDHVHITAFASGGGSGGAGTTGGTAAPVPNPKQVLFDRLWPPVEKRAKSTMDPMRNADPVLQQAAAFMSDRSIEAAGQLIDSKIPDTIMGSGGTGDLPSGSSPKGLTIGEALSQGGWPGNLLVPASSVVYHESGGNARAQNPSGARGLMQIMPGTASGVGANYDQLYDPVYNTSTGMKVYNQAGGFGPWVAAGRGGDYRDTAVTGYRLGGIVPGRPGSPRILKAHAGERILPAGLTRSFDNLASAVGRLDKESGAGGMGEVGGYDSGETASEVRALREENAAHAFAMQTLLSALPDEMREGVIKNLKNGPRHQDAAREGVKQSEGRHKALTGTF